MTDRNTSDAVSTFHTAVVVAGHTGDRDLVLAGLHHEYGPVRASALTALQRLGALTADILREFLGDPEAEVRRRVAELAATYPLVDLTPLLDDTDNLVIEMTAWAIGEQGSSGNGDIPDLTMNRLVELATSHDDPLVRESAVAALGALQDERGRAAIISACTDKPAIRRRAVLALASFSDDEVIEVLQRALEDRDWQVRQAAEDVLGPDLARSGSGALDDQHDTEDHEED